MKKYIDLEEFKRKFVRLGWSDQIPEEELDSMVVEGELLPKEVIDKITSIFDGARSESNLPDGLEYPYLQLTFEDDNGCYDETFEDFTELLYIVNTLFDRNILDKTEERSELFLCWNEKEKYKISLVPKFEDFNKEWNENAKLVEIVYLREVEGAPHLYKCAYKRPYSTSYIGDAIIKKVSFPETTILLRADDESEVYLNVKRVE